MKPGYIWAVIITMAVANYLVRFVPIAVVSRLELPAPVRRWLSFVPVSVMAALVASEVLHPKGRFVPLTHNPYLWAALPTALVFAKTRSFLGSTLAGVAFFLAFRALLG